MNQKKNLKKKKETKRKEELVLHIFMTHVC